MSVQEVLPTKLNAARKAACDLLNRAHIAITPKEVLADKAACPGK